MSDTRSFLLLQGPMGSFFKKLAAELRSRGHRTLRVNFNGGDRLHFSSRYATDFLGTLEEWPQAVEEIALRHGITDVILYGDCRPLHQAAIRVLSPRGIRVHVFEEGYFRPDWVTLERDGVNGFSRLPKDPEFYRQGSGTTEEQPMQASELGSSFPRLVRHTVSYYMAAALGEVHYRHYRTHRLRTYQTEGIAWIWRLSEIALLKRLLRQAHQRVIEDPRPYFLVLLQLLGDSQITHHSPYHDMYEFLNEVLHDFTEQAPKDMRIVVKNHPLDNGLTRYKSFLQQKARSLGLGDRLVFIDGGHLPSLLSQARGVVTVNSTGGLSAVHHELPVKLMGNAVYALPGLVSQKPLSEFWNQPDRPDMKLYLAFRHYALTHAQVHGGFYTRAAIREAVKGSVARILGP